MTSCNGGSLWEGSCVIDVITPRSPVNVEVTAPAEERLSTAIEETSEGKAQIDVP
eukprot:CAMPEP_0185912292 /NCGR_PEP_ID=MMETSP0196C-20130402/38182_1 /TAXON_ID=2932 /ORGANISM="Alexandrium fundyense, Strain CCMP1719" /LENGTH=54 /DNA_ID=CAMNT_0028633513 /DNA_START=108 /DNA_END=268 /DNA_ORIENTATION=-